MKKYLCIHGHFYQPPRENAWLEEIEIQDSASPFHDWNERISSECYRPNATSRILNDWDRIIDIVNNYSKISFNFGPTLLSWMESNAPDTYTAILKADRMSMEHFDGHGSAMAQVYNHIIMPLANSRDQITQVLWGLEDFRSRFGREAEGMWLAETAVNVDTLEVLADYGVKFTVLAPRQANRYRKVGNPKWINGIDPKRHYVCNLPSGKQITLFFYDGERSQDVAFKGLLKNGREFAVSLVSSFGDRTEPQLVHIATDGESYGHHHRHGDMALAFCMRYIETNDLAQLTNYSQYMNLVPADHEVEIRENTSWSCYHGIERWRSNCGCGDESGYHQKWRAPLRESLNWLRDQLAAVYEQQMEIECIRLRTPERACVRSFEARRARSARPSISTRRFVPGASTSGS
jgi:alpha-amylase/alpha-mannosidase (GH57 family)